MGKEFLGKLGITMTGTNIAHRAGSVKGIKNLDYPLHPLYRVNPFCE